VPRPSRNIDVALLRAGRQLYPAAGVQGLSVRSVAERAGVNLGMFHYHFRSKDAFVRALLTEMYNGMFGDLTLAAGDARPVEALRNALLVLARFARDNRRALRRILLDALDDEPVAREFISTNMPRHVRVILGLVKAGQRSGGLRKLPPTQALAFAAGAVAAPILLGTLITEHRDSPDAVRRAFERSVLTDPALAQRVDLVIAALCKPRGAKS